MEREHVVKLFLHMYSQSMNSLFAPLSTREGSVYVLPVSMVSTMTLTLSDLESPPLEDVMVSMGGYRLSHLGWNFWSGFSSIFCVCTTNFLMDSSISGITSTDRTEN